MSRSSTITRPSAGGRGRKLSPVSPGEILQEEFLRPLGISQYRLAKALTVPPRRINEIVHGKRAVTADTALILARVFANSPEFWLNVQRRGDLWEAQHSARRRARIRRARPLIAEASRA